MKQYYVIARCFGDYYQVDFRGSRYRCRKFVAAKNAAGRHTATTMITCNPERIARINRMPLRGL